MRGELTWTETIPPPLKPHGDCVLTLDEYDKLHIDQADPRVLVSAELLDQIRNGNGVPRVTLDGDLLRIEGVNRTVVYRIGKKVPDMLAYYAEWPD